MEKHYLTIFLSLIIAFFFSFFFNPIYDFSVYIWSYISLAFVLSVVFRVIFLKKREDILFFTVLFLTWLNFLEPYIRSEKVTYFFRIIPDAYLFNMSFFSAMGLIALYIGYYTGFSNRFVKPIFKLKNKFNSKQIGQTMIIFIFIYIIFKILITLFPDFIQPIIGILGILRYIPSLISAGITLMFLRKNNNILTVSFLLLFLFIVFLIAIAQTLFISVILIVFPPFLIYFFEKNKVPIISIIISVVLLSPVFLLRHYYREQASEWWYGDMEVNDIFLINQGLKILNETYGKDNFIDVSDKVIDADKKAESRFEQVSYLGQCVYQHEIIGRPYLYGETFWWLPIAPIPRAIFPLKPENILATKLAGEYGLRGKGSKASMNWPMLVEYYINFGFFGIIFLSFFQGMAYKYTYKLLAFGHGDLNLIALFSLILPIIKIESNVTLIFGQIIQFLLIWYVLSVTLLKKYKYKKNKT